MDVVIHNLTGNKETKSMLVTKDTQISCFCLNRPSFNVYLTENGQKEYLGKIIDNFDCINQTFTIKDDKDKLLYKIFASICQPGFCCNHCPLDACQTVTFELTDANGRMI